MKRCTDCRVEKPLTDFYSRANRSGGRSAFPECKECSKARSRANNARYAAREDVEIPETHTCSWCQQTLPGTAFSRSRTRFRGIQSICKECYKVRRYGITRDDYARLLDEQGGVCAICGHPCPRIDVLVIDHDHGTGEVRGLLCTGCNLGLGGFADDPDRLISAVAYLLRRADVLGAI